jgi:hypothetical protein
MIAALAAAVLLSAACDLEAPTGEPGCRREDVDTLRMNALQTVGTHNSYKQAISPAELAQIRAFSPKDAIGLDYAHPPLTAQLNDGARQLELDIVGDPRPGVYATPLGQRVKGAAPYDLGAYRSAGLKVIHVPDLDYRTNCQPFTACLAEIRAWSQAHREHIPLMILLNLKEGGLKLPGAAPAPVFDAAAMDLVDREIRQVFPETELITPDKVQGGRKTLREAVLDNGWPTLKAARGKVMFALDAPPEQVARYRGARRSLEGRVMFVNIEETSSAAGYITLNEPVELDARIRAAVRAGLIVRTRADADTVEARANDTARQAAAFASGAQYISTDYRQPDPRFGPYQVRLPGGGVARPNPVLTAR